jgi:hypothetical protein
MRFENKEKQFEQILSRFPPYVDNRVVDWSLDDLNSGFHTSKKAGPVGKLTFNLC